MATRNTKSSGILTGKMLNFVACWAGNATAAARAAGYKNPVASSKKLMKNPAITKLIGTRQESMAKESGKLLAKQITVCRIDVINRLWELARLEPMDTNRNIAGQIKAAEALAQIFDIKIVRTADLDKELKGKTQEIDVFVATGLWTGPEEQAPLAETPKGENNEPMDQG